MKSHKLLTFAVAAIMATSGLSTMIPTQSALASGPSQGAQSQHVGPMTCVPFFGRPGSSGQLPSESSHQTGELTVGNEWIPPAAPICPARL